MNSVCMNLRVILTWLTTNLVIQRCQPTEVNDNTTRTKDQQIKDIHGHTGLHMSRIIITELEVCCFVYFFKLFVLSSILEVNILYFIENVVCIERTREITQGFVIICSLQWELNVCIYMDVLFQFSIF